ncbi:hypothetical protein TcasGA2_TC003551 [Tribolium castaneum]|uniref:Uncharacterized protein n=1 Tax=Tribolium castaneum TaxID=7070 RepID=D6WHJ5_TRICA|nr:hypothetical protein TcasGA2_TC003551 [Tribolium castaneum]
MQHELGKPPVQLHLFGLCKDVGYVTGSNFSFSRTTARYERKHFIPKVIKTLANNYEAVDKDLTLGFILSECFSQYELQLKLVKHQLAGQTSLASQLIMKVTLILFFISKVNKKQTFPKVDPIKVMP